MEDQIYTDITDTENDGIQTRNAGKRFDSNAGPKRTALAQVTNLRQQPSRAVKTSNAQFKVYEDEHVTNPRKEPVKRNKPTKRPSNNVALNSIAAASLPAVSTSLTTVHVPNAKVSKPQEVAPAFAVREQPMPVSTESPMVLDESCMETSELTPSVVDISMDRDQSYLCLHEYQQEVHDYLREAELTNRPKPNYMRKQTDISSQMRTILVDWLVEVGEEYKLHDETLHLAVNYIDRFLSQMSVLRGKLQLVGTACMFIASKYEEIYPPDVGEFVYITDDTYTKKQLLRMEHLVIKVLGFDVSSPTANVFLDLYCRQLNVSEQVKCLAQYVMELTLLDCDNYISLYPSIIGSSALFLAAHIVSLQPTAPSTPALDVIEQVTRYSQSQVTLCVKKMLATLNTAHEQPQQAVREKYKADSRRAVALMPIPDRI